MPDSAPHWSRLLEELKQRRVFRAVVLYAVAAWVVVEVASTVFPVLELPAWTVKAVVVTALVGFPVCVGLAWAIDLPGPAAPNRRVALVFLLVLLITVGAWAVWSRRSVASTSLSTSAVAVLPFNVQGDDQVAYLREGMVSLLAANLDGAGDLWSVDPKSVLTAVSEAGAPAEQQARDIARRLGAGFYVTGDVIQAGTQIRITARLERIDGGAAVAASADGAIADLLPLVDRLTAQLIAGQSSAQAGNSVEVTTKSLPAFKAYLSGQKALVSLDFAGALKNFERAVSEDSTFAKAHLGIMWANWWLGLPTDPPLSAAKRHAAHLSEREQRLLLAHDAFFRADDVEAERRYREILNAYPGDLEALYPLSELMVHFSHLRGKSYVETARDPLDRILSSHPMHGEALFHSIHLAVHAGEAQRLDSLLTRAARLPGTSAEFRIISAFRPFVVPDSNSVRLRKERVRQLATADDFTTAVGGAFIATLAGDRHNGRKVLEGLTQPSRVEGVQAAGRAFLALLDAAGGRWRSALDELDAAERIDPAVAILYRGVLAVHPLVASSASLRRRVERDLEQWTPQPERDPVGGLPPFMYTPGGADVVGREYLLGLLAARSGQMQAALQFAQRLDRQPPTQGSLAVDLANAIRAETLIARGDAGAALAALERMQNRAASFNQLYASIIHLRVRERFMRGDLLGQLGRDEEALAWLRTIEHNDGFVYQGLYLAPALYRMAEMYDRRGDRANAARYYGRFVELWKDADPESKPWLDRARRRLAALSVEPRR